MNNWKALSYLINYCYHLISFSDHTKQMVVIGELLRFWWRISRIFQILDRILKDLDQLILTRVVNDLQRFCSEILPRSPIIYYGWFLNWFSCSYYLLGNKDLIVNDMSGSICVTMMGSVCSFPIVIYRGRCRGKCERTCWDSHQENGVFTIK